EVEGAFEADGSTMRPRVPTKGEIEELKQRLHQEERSISLMVAPALDYNPRRIKQFLNSFRLKTYIASLVDVLGPVSLPAPPGRYTLPQIGKFVAIGIRWPQFYADLESDRRLLVKLQLIALMGKPNLRFPKGQEDLMDAIRDAMSMTRVTAEEWKRSY